MPERRVELRLGREKVVQNRKGDGQQRADVTVQQHIERVIPLKQGLHFGAEIRQIGFGRPLIWPYRVSG